MYTNEGYLNEHDNKASEWSNKLKDINPAVMDIILKEVFIVKQETERISMKEEKTDQDMELMIGTREKVEAVLLNISEAETISNAMMVHHAMSIYEYFRNLAAGGNETAIEIVKSLEDDYRRLMEVQADKN